MYFERESEIQKREEEEDREEDWRECMRVYRCLFPINDDAKQWYFVEEKEEEEEDERKTLRR